MKTKSQLNRILVVLSFVALAICSGCATGDPDPGAMQQLYYGAARSSAMQGNYQKANAFRTLGDIYGTQR